mgnify:CR=1 FL=1
MTIKFGTDGWRAIIAEDFTSDNVQICAQAISNYLLKSEDFPDPVIIGYDTRFGSERFAKTIAEVLCSNNIPVILCNKPTPTPVVSYNLIYRECSSGIVVTASHNSYEWNGIKFKPGYGGSASPEIVSQIENEISKLKFEIDSTPLFEAIQNGMVEMYDPDPAYLNHLAEMIDLGNIRNAGMNVVVDAMHGAGAGYLSKLLSGGSTKIFEIRKEINPSFPDMSQPEPINNNLSPLKDAIHNSNSDVGIAFDGDADRVGIIDEYGEYISTLHAFALITFHSLENLDLKGPIVKSITMTSMIDSLAKLHDLPVFETPVGFKYLGQVMMEEDAILAGEESGGYGFKGHIPERDGILSGLMILDMMTKTNKSPSELISDLESVVGPRHYDRQDIDLVELNKFHIEQILNTNPPKKMANLSVINIDARDGFKFFIEDGSWCLVRFSGTEPLIRLYAESNTPEQVKSLIDDCRSLLGV